MPSEPSSTNTPSFEIRSLKLASPFTSVDLNESSDIQDSSAETNSGLSSLWPPSLSPWDFTIDLNSPPAGPVLESLDLMPNTTVSNGSLVNIDMTTTDFEPQSHTSALADHPASPAYSAQSICSFDAFTTSFLEDGPAWRFPAGLFQSTFDTMLSESNWLEDLDWQQTPWSQGAPFEDAQLMQSSETTSATGTYGHFKRVVSSRAAGETLGHVSLLLRLRVF